MPEEVLWRPHGKFALFLIKGYSSVYHCTQMEGLDLLQLCCHQPDTKADTRRVELRNQEKWSRTSEYADLATRPYDLIHFVFFLKKEHVM